MKLFEARNLLSVITQLQASEAARKPKFAYMLAKNKRTLEAIDKDFVEALKDEAAQEALRAFDLDRIALLENLALKDEAGAPVVVNGAYQFHDSVDPALAINAMVAEKHPEVPALVEAQNLKIKELSEKDEDVTLYPLPVSEWPDLPDAIDPVVMDVLYLLMCD